MVLQPSPTPAVTAAEAVSATDISWQQGTRALLAFLVAVALAVLLRRLLVRSIDQRRGSRRIGTVVGRFLGLLVVVLGAVYALDLLGVQIGPLIGALGVGGVALAFAAQDILQNFIAGVLLQIRHPFRVGDQIGSGEFEGVVQDVNLRTTELSTYDGLVVYLPNAEVLKNPIVNYTRTPSSRTSLAVGLDYDTDLAAARQVLLDTCARTEGVHASPPPEVWVETFAESTIDVAVRYWHDADIASRWRVRSELAIAVKSALDAAGMTIAFPQRVVWMSGPAVPDPSDTAR